MSTHVVSRTVLLAFVCAALGVASWLPASRTSAADSPRVLPAGERPDDARLAPPKDLDGYFPFTPPASREAWETRSEEVRRQVQVALGLWPLPERTPLKPVVHGKRDFDDYSVEKVYFESMPGFYVTGSLYRPKGHDGPRPGILCPHGHWANGRFHDAGETSVKQQIEAGGEQFEEGGRSPLQARCVQLARMGCVVFHYDMLGYADSTQISYEVAHRFATQRPEMIDPQNWGLYSPQAEAHLQSVMGLQTWNSIRSLDFLETLDDVDAQRLGVTGASGGGTQTFLLAAVDPRLAISFPAVMVSTAMQGGCTCENCSLLRVDTGNVELAGLFAPKPQAMSAADDWTKEMSTKGFPELQALYELLDAGDFQVALISRTEFGHNYNHVTRSFMYDWFNKHLQLNADTTERDYQRLTADQLTVWDDAHPEPPGGDQFERQLLQQWQADSRGQLQEVLPQNAEQLPRYRELVGGAADVILGGDLPPAEALRVEHRDGTDHEARKTITALVGDTRSGSQLPVVIEQPANWNRKAVIWIDGGGKSALYDDAGQPSGPHQRLLDAGYLVVAADLLYQGEFLAEGESFEETPKVANPREAAAYTHGYNRSVFANRVQDVLTLIAATQPHADQVVLLGTDGGGPIAAAARAQAGDAVALAAIDTEGFRFQNVESIRSPDFLPGGAKYFDLPGLLSLSAPQRLILAGEGDSAPDVTELVYRAAGAADRLQVVGPEQLVTAVLEAGNETE